MTRWLVTGAAGFVGAQLTRTLLDRGETVMGVDNLDPYYDTSLKQARLDRLEPFDGFTFVKTDINDDEVVHALFADCRPDRVVHLAAQVGVRHATSNPKAYATTNLGGFVNVLEGCRAQAVGHLVYASSSAVYGVGSSQPFSTHHPVGHPLSLYAATKRANELLAHSYSHLYGLPTTGLRFFTVYGPWGRPDMAYYRFARAIVDGEALPIYGDGSALRDFTYVDDVVEGILRVADAPPRPDEVEDYTDPAASPAPYRVTNIGRGEQVSVARLVELLEQELGREAIREHLPTHPGDVPHTHADVRDLQELVGYRPRVSIEEGIARFVTWFREWERV